MKFNDRWSACLGSWRAVTATSSFVADCSRISSNTQSLRTPAWCHAEHPMFDVSNISWRVIITVLIWVCQQKTLIAESTCSTSILCDEFFFVARKNIEFTNQPVSRLSPSQGTYAWLTCCVIIINSPGLNSTQSLLCNSERLRVKILGTSLHQIPSRIWSEHFAVCRAWESGDRILLWFCNPLMSLTAYCCISKNPGLTPLVTQLLTASSLLASAFYAMFGAVLRISLVLRIISSTSQSFRLRNTARLSFNSPSCWSISREYVHYKLFPTSVRIISGREAQI